MSAPEVSQADRDAAEAYWNSASDDWNPWCDISEDERQLTVQALARHRHQSTAPLIAALEQAREVIQRLDAMWLEDWEPPHPDKAKQEPRIITEQCLDVWRDARAALAAIAAAGGNV